jgi:hypothetical protein
MMNYTSLLCTTHRRRALLKVAAFSESFHIDVIVAARQIVEHACVLHASAHAGEKKRKKFPNLWAVTAREIVILSHGHAANGAQTRVPVDLSARGHHVQVNIGRVVAPRQRDAKPVVFASDGIQRKSAIAGARRRSGEGEVRRVLNVCNVGR